MYPKWLKNKRISGEHGYEVVPSYSRAHYPCDTKPLCVKRHYVSLSQSTPTSSVFFQTLFARALFDNTAESEDELAFQKGDIIMVLDKNVAGSPGWWKCSVHGRKGLAPANRLGLISSALAQNFCANLSTECDTLGIQSYKNIYQTPKSARLSPVDPIYEDMNMIYKLSPPCIPSADKHMSQDDPEGTGSPRDVSVSLHSTLEFCRIWPFLWAE